MQETIKAAIDLANDSYKAGYDAGFLAGQKHGLNQAMAIISAAPTRSANVCLNCGEDLTNYPTTAAAHQCSPMGKSSEDAPHA